MIITEKRITLSFTFDVKITNDETNVEAAKDSNDAYSRANSRRLLLAILEQPEQLQRVLTSKAALHLPEEPEHRFLGMEKPTNYEELFAASVAVLNQEDQAYWTRVGSKDIEFITLLGDIYRSIHVNCVDCTSEIVDPVEAR